MLIYYIIYIISLVFAIDDNDFILEEKVNEEYEFYDDFGDDFDDDFDDDNEFRVEDKTNEREH
ncbi:hypothetical protein ENUP19_0121G0019 [Entamoeba nuttalli]|uniref:Uncharacterized protein n=2 Tax=Entamoeba nuttalli TaxID=412467 RepID=K2H442_ENTNP|nr:hypothetical protein ENU1_025670 [Entamoeba nuttalli P19]EKE42303.1 hypothetical protein ENU1_025670 [Entamoeba nuttalli P19]|eukprot:XP_008855363.1 hypothetical protein ENU1_025670 [Entamoeba nuttalli P19]